MGELPACVLFIFSLSNCDELALRCVSVLHQVLHHLSLFHKVCGNGSWQLRYFWCATSASCRGRRLRDDFVLSLHRMVGVEILCDQDYGVQYRITRVIMMFEQ
jgi:hypothetical protein